jgi:hypothetical protein
MYKDLKTVSFLGGIRTRDRLFCGGCDENNATLPQCDWTNIYFEQFFN